ncbi:regulatory protein RecX [Ningiella sp. W23]|uniref:regulatory protein RecX n=1 Tax=Ningiella sp. W23 TaxID=3023715 RepID=UPI003757A960
MDEELQRSFRHAITRLLSRREHSREEIISKLKHKGLCESLEHEAVLTQMLDRFADKDIQSDCRYAQAFVRSAFEKGKGPGFIEQSLAQHNIDAAYVRQCINEEEFDWFDLAAKVRIKRFGEAMPSDWHDIQKQKRFLQYRGFLQAHISELFS